MALRDVSEAMGVARGRCLAVSLLGWLGGTAAVAQADPVPVTSVDVVAAMVADAAPASDVLTSDFSESFFGGPSFYARALRPRARGDSLSFLGQSSLPLDPSSDPNASAVPRYAWSQCSFEALRRCQLKVLRLDQQPRTVGDTPPGAWDRLPRFAGNNLVFVRSISRADDQVRRAAINGLPGSSVAARPPSVLAAPRQVLALAPGPQSSLAVVWQGRRAGKTAHVVRLHRPGRTPRMIYSAQPTVRRVLALAWYRGELVVLTRAKDATRLHRHSPTSGRTRTYRGPARAANMALAANLTWTETTTAVLRTGRCAPTCRILQQPASQMLSGSRLIDHQTRP